MISEESKSRQQVYKRAFKVPSFQTVGSRKSTITNAFVGQIIPVIKPEWNEIKDALAILGMEPENVVCAYCGDPVREWDHLRPLVVGQRPTGFITEIANLVPCCSNCNGSKRNENWRVWMLSDTPKSPFGKKVQNLEERIRRLEVYEAWRVPTRLDFEAILGKAEWEDYWLLWVELNKELAKCQDVGKALRIKIQKFLKNQLD